MARYVVLYSVTVEAEDRNEASQLAWDQEPTEDRILTEEEYEKLT